TGLMEYLKHRVDSAIKSYTFYFPLVNMEIEVPFTIGGVEFTFFTEKDMEHLYNSMLDSKNPISPSTFQEKYRSPFLGQVLAKIRVEAEREKAEEIAKRAAEISTD